MYPNPTRYPPLTQPEILFPLKSFVYNILIFIENMKSLILKEKIKQYIKLTKMFKSPVISDID